MEQLAENIWIKEFPLSLLGGHQGRVVTVIRLGTGKLVIHSTAPFTGADVTEIKALGTPGWLVDAMLRHDTFAQQGRAAAFPGIPYLAPEGFAGIARVDSQPILPAPPAWSAEIRVLLIGGMPKAKEHVFLHIPSRTLIVADLVFNFGHSSDWAGFFRSVLMGVKLQPDSARLVPMQIQDRPAYDSSIRQMLAWDFDRIVVGHKEVVETNGKERLKQGLASKGILPV